MIKIESRDILRIEDKNACVYKYVNRFPEIYILQSDVSNMFVT